MLAAVDLRLYPKTDVELPHPSGHLVHAAVLDAVQDVNPKLSNALHDDVQTKSIAISTLWSKVRATGDSLSIPKYTECRLRICTLTRTIFEALSEALFPKVAANSEIKIGKYGFVLLNAVLEPPYGGVTNYSDLLIRSRRQVTLRFTSPTTFRRSGINIPFPESSLVYQSIWQKWQAFSEEKVSEELFKQIIGAVAVSAFDGHTRVWKFPRYKMAGFVGTARYELVKQVSEDAKHLFSALSEMAFYSGVGYKTTMGMGQCRIVEDESIESAADIAEEVVIMSADGGSLR